MGILPPYTTLLVLSALNRALSQMTVAQFLPKELLGPLLQPENCVWVSHWACPELKLSYHPHTSAPFISSNSGHTLIRPGIPPQKPETPPRHPSLTSAVLSLSQMHSNSHNSHNHYPSKAIAVHCLENQKSFLTGLDISVHLMHNGDVLELGWSCRNAKVSWHSPFQSSPLPLGQRWNPYCGPSCSGTL